VTGLLLAGIGHVDNQQKKNFLIVDSSTSYSDEVETQTNVIESAFQDYTERKDIAILLINQHVSHTFLFAWMKLILQIAEKIRPAVDRYQAAFPALLEIPSKEHPYGMSYFT
jgi:V-type H+-transporting ATPase subunit F